MARSRYVPAKLRRLVVKRARALCEYCRLPQALCAQMLEIDHINPRSRGGVAAFGNLCLACSPCNNAKRERTQADDPTSERRVRLFNPRVDRWERHFRWSEDFGTIIGLTAIGRATVAALEMNNPRVVALRLLWVTWDKFPPK